MIWTILNVATIVFLLTSAFFIYKFIWPTLTTMQDVLHKLDVAAAKAQLVADDLEASHLRAEELSGHLPGEAADAAMQRPNGNGHSEV